MRRKVGERIPKRLEEFFVVGNVLQPEGRVLQDREKGLHGFRGLRKKESSFKRCDTRHPCRGAHQCWGKEKPPEEEQGKGGRSEWEI